MVKNKTAYILLIIISCAAALARADTVSLKNGGSVEGIIEKEDGQTLEISMGFGTVTFNKSQIKNIERSSPEESRQMMKGWKEKRIELKMKEEEFARARDERYKNAYDDLMEDARQKREKEEGSAKQIKITRDPGSKSIVVETLLNNNVKANLILDTGASIIALSRKVGEDLGVDLLDTKKDIMELRLADGRRTMAKVVILDSVKIQGLEVKKVMAAVMFDQVPGPGLRDGLLGMSFLNNFNLKTDLKSMSMSLEKIEQ